MRHRRSLSATLALLSAWLGLPAPARAQTQPQKFRQIVATHDYDSATPTACVLGNVIQGVGSVSTAGSSTTVTAATTGALSPVLAGAELSIDPPGANPMVVAYVNTGGASSVVVNDNINIGAGASWSYRLLTCGTAAGSGWFGVGDVTPRRTWKLSIDQISLASGSMAVVLQCRDASPWNQQGQVYPPITPASANQCDTGLFTSATTCYIVDNDIDVSTCRWLVSLTDDGGDTGANREKVSISVTGAME